MRHRKAGVKLNRTASHRSAMFRNMVTSLLKHERIQTTHAKAREVRRWADHIITLAKRGDLHARRQALSILREKDVVYKIFDTAGERFGALNGGYTRVIKIGRRSGDAAPISIVELVGPHEGKKGRGVKKKKKRAAEPQAGAVPATAVAGEAAAGDEPAAEADVAVDHAEIQDEPAKKAPSAAADEAGPAAASTDDLPDDTPDPVSAADESPAAVDATGEKPDTEK